MVTRVDTAAGLPRRFAPRNDKGGCAPYYDRDRYTPGYDNGFGFNLRRCL